MVATRETVVPGEGAMINKAQTVAYRLSQAISERSERLDDLYRRMDDRLYALPDDDTIAELNAAETSLEILALMAQAGAIETALDALVASFDKSVQKLGRIQAYTPPPPSRRY